MEVVLSQLLSAVALVLRELLWLYGLILIVRIVAGWLNADPRNPIVSFLMAVTDPVLYEVRRRLPFVVMGGLDLSPIVVFLAILFIRTLVVDSLLRLASEIG